MVDGSQSGLEMRLREALRAEADGIPLTVRAIDLEREWRRRGRRRRALPALVAAAVVVAVVIGSAVAWRSGLVDVAGTPRPSSEEPSTPIAPRALAGYAELEALLTEAAPSMPVVLRGEQATASPGPAAVTTELGTVGPYHFLNFAVDCDGGALRIAVEAGDTVVFASEQACDPHPWLLTDGIESPFADTRVVIEAVPGVRWRIVASALHLADAGIVVSAIVAGGPPGALDRGQIETVTVLAGDQVVARQEVPSGSSVTIPLEPGRYVVSGSYGNADCERHTVEVAPGALAPVAMVCSIR